MSNFCWVWLIVEHQNIGITACFWADTNICQIGHMFRWYAQFRTYHDIIVSTLFMPQSTCCFILSIYYLEHILGNPALEAMWSHHNYYFFFSIKKVTICLRRFSCEQLLLSLVHLETSKPWTTVFCSPYTHISHIGHLCRCYAHLRFSMSHSTCCFVLNICYLEHSLGKHWFYRHFHHVSSFSKKKNHVTICFADCLL